MTDEPHVLRPNPVRNPAAGSYRELVRILSGLLPPAEEQPPAVPAAPDAELPTAAHAGDRAPAAPVAPAKNLAAEAEHYAILYPRRARLIRRYVGLPRDYDFGPPKAALVRAIVSGTSPALRALDPGAA